MLDYDYIIIHYRLIAVDLSRPKELDADMIAIQQTGCVGQLKKIWWCKCWWYTIHVCFKDFRENWRNETKSFSRKCKCLIRDYKGAIVTLTTTQLNKLKTAAKDNTLRIKNK